MILKPKAALVACYQALDLQVSREVKVKNLGSAFMSDFYSSGYRGHGDCYGEGLSHIVQQTYSSSDGLKRKRIDGNEH